MDNSVYILKLFADQPGRIRLIRDGVSEAVAGSFVADGSRITTSEVSRRRDICTKAFVMLFKECGWASIRCIDELPKALRSELDGVPYTPTRSGKNSWGADNGRDLIWLPV